MGRSCSGKDTMINWLCKTDEKYKRIITYTTRPKRQFEINGLDYNFVSDEYFQYMRTHNQLIECADYLVADGSFWWYGSQITEEQYKSDTIYLIALTPGGIVNMNRKIPKKYRASIYFDIPADLALERALKRDGTTEEVYRRHKADSKMFDSVTTQLIPDATIKIRNGKLINLGRDVDYEIMKLVKERKS